MSASKLHRFSTQIPNIQCIVSGVTHTIHVQSGAPRCTVASETSFSAPGKHAFEVLMKDKQVKTAVGFLSENKTTQYMRDTPIGESHISMGGAGWIHPKEIRTQHKYSQGDRVKIEVDFDKDIVSFYVNDCFTGKDEWTPKIAFPAISIDGGPCELHVSFE